MDRSPLRNYLFPFVFILFVFAGCNAPKRQLGTFDEYFRSSNYEKSIEFAQSKISKSTNPKKEDLLWTLQLGTLERLKQNYQESNGYFDKSEEMLNYFDYHRSFTHSVFGIKLAANPANMKFDGNNLNIQFPGDFLV